MTGQSVHKRTREIRGGGRQANTTTFGNLKPGCSVALPGNARKLKLGVKKAKKEPDLKA